MLAEFWVFIVFCKTYLIAGQNVLKIKEWKASVTLNNVLRKNERLAGRHTFLPKKIFKFNKILADYILSEHSLERNCFILSVVYIGCTKESLHYHSRMGSCNIFNIIKYSICKLK